MALQESIIIEEKRLSVGSKLQSNIQAANKGMCPLNEIVEIRAIKSHEDLIYIGLYSNNTHKSWGSLDGMTPPYQGLWIDSGTLFSFFELFHCQKMITEDFNFKKRNLKGMKCRILCHDSKQDQCFVELDDNVGGGSADGLGKTGHCVVLSSSLLKNAEDHVESNHKKKKFGGVHEYRDIEALDTTINTEQNPGKWFLLDKEPVANLLLKQPYQKRSKISKPAQVDNDAWERAAKDLWCNDLSPPEKYKDKWETDQILQAAKLKLSKLHVDEGGYIDFGTEPDFYDES